jgi:REP element-mobilizing transposase RayT
MEKFQNRYRISSARASWWNYSANGCYFITICTINHQHLLGNIVGDIMQLSPIGEIANEEWHKSFGIRKELFCGAFMIMPNHIHAILRIDNPDNVVIKTHGIGPVCCRDAQPCVSTTTELQLPPSKSQKPKRPPKSISSFVAGFKSSATTRINKFRNMPKTSVWQSRFHDHIIRNKGEYQRIINYIYENPAKWADDEFYTLQ